MKKNLFLAIAFICIGVVGAQAQEIQTVFKGGRVTGYAALSNKFTTINGEFANLPEFYAGVFLNRKVFLGIGAAAMTNDIRVPNQYAVDPDRKLSYGYGQFGMVTEYVLGSNKAVHAVFHLFTGAGFTMQYERYSWDDDDDFLDDDLESRDENWFFVAEPGVQLEVNLFRWMRFSPGISYRTAIGSKADGLSDASLSNISYNLTLKFGKF